MKEYGKVFFRTFKSNYTYKPGRIERIKNFILYKILHKEPPKPVNWADAVQKYREMELDALNNAFNNAYDFDTGGKKMKNKITLEYKNGIVIHTKTSSTTHIAYITQIPIEQIKYVDKNIFFLEVTIYIQGGWVDIKTNSKTQTKQFARKIRKWRKEYHKAKED